MKTTEIMTIIFGVLTGGCLATMQIRRIIKGDVPLFGPEVFKAYSKINVDRFEKRMLVVTGLFFALFVIFIVLSYK